VHWHGIELQQSYPDGVPGWSGSGNETPPGNRPGDSLTVQFTPPRAGTFMYHSHFKRVPADHLGHVRAAHSCRKPGQKFDPRTDKVLLFSDGGPTTNVIAGPFPPMLMNGQVQPDPIDLKGRG
jgi:hypothetical protein